MGNIFGEIHGFHFYLLFTIKPSGTTNCLMITLWMIKFEKFTRLYISEIVQTLENFLTMSGVENIWNVNLYVPYTCIKSHAISCSLLPQTFSSFFTSKQPCTDCMDTRWQKKLHLLFIFISRHLLYIYNKQREKKKYFFFKWIMLIWTFHNIRRCLYTLFTFIILNKLMIQCNEQVSLL